MALDGEFVCCVDGCDDRGEIEVERKDALLWICGEHYQAFFGKKVIEGYLLMYHCDGDEIHTDLITPEHYAEFEKVFNKYPKGDTTSPEACSPRTGSLDEELSKTAHAHKPIIRWFTQTRCHGEWLGEVRILGHVCICMY